MSGIHLFEHLPTVGPLDRVSNISVNISQEILEIKWDPPFSLDLTNIDPDVIYTVEVYKTTCGGNPKSLVTSDSTLFDPAYIHTQEAVNMTLDMDLLDFKIIPRSNSKRSINGAASTINGNIFDCTGHSKYYFFVLIGVQKCIHCPRWTLISTKLRTKST